jgi:hypothetical protein
MSATRSSSASSPTDRRTRAPVMPAAAFVARHGGYMVTGTRRSSTPRGSLPGSQAEPAQELPERLAVELSSAGPRAWRARAERVQDGLQPRMVHACRGRPAVVRCRWRSPAGRRGARTASSFPAAAARVRGPGSRPRSSDALERWPRTPVRVTASRRRGRCGAQELGRAVQDDRSRAIGRRCGANGCRRAPDSRSRAIGDAPRSVIEQWVRPLRRARVLA